MTFCVNGRYTVHRVTGMQRYAHQIVTRLGDLCDVARPQRPIRGFRGHWWEQWSLPRHTRGRLLWSPCSTGPLSVRRHVVTIHDCAFVDQANCFSRSFAAWYQWLIPRLARKSLQIITVSEFSKGRIAEYCEVPAEKIDVVHNGVDSRYAPQDPSAVGETLYRLQFPQPYILYVGSLEPRKNLPRLLAAWRLIQGEFDDLSLVVVGVAGKVFRAANLQNVPTRVHLAGYINDTDLPHVYSGAELFAYPSLYEGFGLPVVEAMACGTPVVCSNNTSLAEVAGEAAELVDPNDIEVIAHGLRRVLGDATRRAELVELGIAQAMRFCWDTAAVQTLAILRACQEK